MIKSMTGYGRAESVAGKKKIRVEIKSVNNRYHDINIRFSKYSMVLEEKVRVFLLSHISRGKVDVFISLEDIGEHEKSVTLNGQIAEKYFVALQQLRDRFALKDDITVTSLARFPDVLTSEYVQEDEEELWKLIQPVLEEAFQNFNAMRESEGARMADDLKQKAASIRAMAEELDEVIPACIENHRTKTLARIKELVGTEVELDETRLMTEIAIYTDKISIAEETVRLKSHVDELHKILDSGEAVGRKLDFLAQEFNREANTIGSKSNHIETSKLALSIKCEIEKMREQIQNIE
jgi:uncharacterized protein (TIGR00255 family)